MTQVHWMLNEKTETIYNLDHFDKLTKKVVEDVFYIVGWVGGKSVPIFGGTEEARDEVWKRVIETLAGGQWDYHATNREAGGP